MHDINRMIDQFVAGRITRREFTMGLTGLIAAASGSRELSGQAPAPTFRAQGLNHLALRVTDLARTQAFYERHLGVTRIPSAGESPRLLAVGPHVLNMFKADRPQMDHVCFTVPDYDPKVAASRLREGGIEPDVEGDRVHFFDPDGYKLQVGGPAAGGQQLPASPARR